MVPTHRMQIRLTPSLLAALNLEVDASGEPYSTVIRRCIAAQLAHRMQSPAFAAEYAHCAKLLRSDDVPSVEEEGTVRRGARPA